MMNKELGKKLFLASPKLAEFKVDASRYNLAAWAAKLYPQDEPEVEDETPEMKQVHVSGENLMVIFGDDFLVER